MKDYADKMNAEEARLFREAVVNIVGQIPCGKVTTYGLIATLAGWPSPFAHGRPYTSLYARMCIPTLPPCSECRRPHGSRMASAARTFRS